MFTFDRIARDGVQDVRSSETTSNTARFLGNRAAFRKERFARTVSLNGQYSDTALFLSQR